MLHWALGQQWASLLYMHKPSQFVDSQCSGTRLWGLADFLILIIAKAMPEQTHHKYLAGGVKNFVSL